MAVITGSNNNDPHLDGTALADTITGKAGIDTLNGLNGDDTLYGGAGADSLYGGNQNDLLEGGTGNDLLNGGAGVDGITYANATAGWTVRLAATTTAPITPPKATSGGETDTLASIENVIGSKYADYIYGNAGANNLDGGAASDTIQGEDGADVITGGDGDDKLQGDQLGSGGDGDGNDTMYGGIGDDTVRGAGGDDRLYGGDGDDWLRPDIGTDFADGGTGDDNIRMGAGNDTVVTGSGYDIVEYQMDSSDHGRDLITDFDTRFDRFNTNGYHTNSLPSFDAFDSNNNGVLDNADIWVNVQNFTLNGLTRSSTIIDVGAANGDGANSDTLTAFNATGLNSTDFL